MSIISFQHISQAKLARLQLSLQIINSTSEQIDKENFGNQSIHVANSSSFPRAKHGYRKGDRGSQLVRDSRNHYSGCKRTLNKITNQATQSKKAKFPAVLAYVAKQPHNYPRVSYAGIARGWELPNNSRITVFFRLTTPV